MHTTPASGWVAKGGAWVGGAAGTEESAIDLVCREQDNKVVVKN